MTNLELYDEDDRLNFANQFTNLGIDTDRANALSQILTRETLDPFAIADRTDEERELIAGVVSNLLPCDSPDEFEDVFGDNGSTENYLNNLGVGDRVSLDLIDQFRTELAEEDSDNFDNPNW